MADFYQHEEITTLHMLKKDNAGQLEADLNQYTQNKPLALILPSIYAELEGKALPNILEQLKTVKYLHEIVITMGATDEEQFTKAKRFFSVLPQRHTILWNTGPRIGELYELLTRSNISIGDDGKGRSVWMAIGYLLSRGSVNVMALHDCDIMTYEKGLLTRLAYPCVHPTLDYEYTKGYYARFSTTLHGRVVRLFVIPFIRSLKSILGSNTFLDFMDCFRYPLSGEFCLLSGIGRNIRIPSDWGLEVGLLNEIYRNCANKRICQVEIAERYDHKHQAFDPEQLKKGLGKMTMDITKSIMRTLTSTGVTIFPDMVRTLKAAYLRTALDLVARYAHDAEFNGLEYDRHREEQFVDRFVECMMQGVQDFFEFPMEMPFLPNWNRVFSAIPDFGDRLKSAIEADNT